MTPNEGNAVNIGAAVRDGLRLKTVEVVALLHNCCEQLDAGTAAALHPSIDDLWVTDAGTVVLPRIARKEPIRAAVASLLEQLLPPLNDGADVVPPALRTLPSRLRDSGDSQGSELKDLLTILRWHLPADSREVLRDLSTRVQLGSAEPAAAAPIELFAAEETESEAIAASGSIAAGLTKRPWRPSAAIVENAPDEVPPAAVPASPVPAIAAAAHAAPAEVATTRTRSWLPLVAAAVLITLGSAGYAGYLATIDRAPTAAESNTTVQFPPSTAESSAAPASAATTAGTSAQVDTPSIDSTAVRTRVLDLPVQGGAFSPSFAASGSQLLFHAGHNTSGRLFEASLDSGRRASAVMPLLDDRGRTYHARPSPDGNWVAFDSDRDGERGVYVAARDGSNLARVSGDGFAAVPSWSPDMRWLAFVRAEPQRPKVWNLWMRDVTTGELTRQTNYRSGQVWGASWFPDGRALCYSHEDELIVVRPDGAAVASFASPIKGRIVRTPAVSPDGKSVVFQVYRDGAWLLDLGSGAMRRILSDPTAEEFAWDPSGEQIAYHSRRDGQWRIWMLRM